MLEILNITFPFFGLVLCGFWAVHKQFLAVDSIPSLNGFVLFFALPCMLYKFGSSIPLLQLLDVGVLVAYSVSALLIVLISIFLTVNQRISWNDRAFRSLVSAFPNTGFMGVPLLVALLGPLSSGPAIVTIIVDLVATSSLCIALSRVDNIGACRSYQAGKQALAGVLINPLPWAVLLGALSSGFEFQLPQPMMKVVSMLADAASPVALFTIGAVLARSKILMKVEKGSEIVMKDVLPSVLIKLFLHPILIFVIGSALIQIGLPLDKAALTVIVLVAALPSASNVSLLAERFQADTSVIARIIMISTTFSCVTFPIFAWLVFQNY